MSSKSPCQSTKSGLMADFKWPRWPTAHRPGAPSSGRTLALGRAARPKEGQASRAPSLTLTHALLSLSLSHSAKVEEHCAIAATKLHRPSLPPRHTIVQSLAYTEPSCHPLHP